MDGNKDIKKSANQNNSIQSKGKLMPSKNISQHPQSDLMKFIQAFENKNWYWKMKAIKSYKINENLLNLYFEHKSQIDMLKVEINNPENIKLAKSRIKTGLVLNEIAEKNNCQFRNCCQF